MSENAFEAAGIHAEMNVAITMRDGVTLRANIFRPAEGGPVPALVLRIPYNKDAAQTYVYAHPAWYARHGYAVLVQDSRGRYASEGEFYPLRLDGEDGFDTIEWCAAQPWCDGKVGSYGFSIPGINQLLAAHLRPPALTTAIPAFYPSGMHDGFLYRGGALSLATLAQWAVVIAADAAIRKGDMEALAQVVPADQLSGKWHPGTPLKDTPFFMTPDSLPFIADYLAHPGQDDYWQEWHLPSRLDSVDIPCLHISGWYDTFIAKTMESYETLSAAAQAEHRLLVGPWYHIPWTQQVGAIDYGWEARNFVDDYQIAWFDAQLKGDRSKLDALPMVRIFVTGANEWRDYDAWPLAGTSSENWYLHSSGRANSLSGDGSLSHQAPGEEGADFYIYGPEGPVESLGGHSCCLPDRAPMGPEDQRQVEYRNDVLVYSSAPLETPLFIAGNVNAVLHAASSAVDTDFTVKLCDVAPDGTAINITEGIIRARYRESLEREVMLEPNAIYEFTIAAGVACHRFAAGHRVRVEVSSSNFPHFDRNPNNGKPFGEDDELVTASQTVFHDSARPSHIELPVVAGG
jgi:putative CocE/NonD family hydrolase